MQGLTADGAIDATLVERARKSDRVALAAPSVGSRRLSAVWRGGSSHERARGKGQTGAGAPGALG